MASCNEEKCPCTSTNCERHGKCCACINHHREKGTLTSCMKQIANARQ